MKTLRVALLGLGSVGLGVVNVLSNPIHGCTITAVADSKSGVISQNGEGIQINEILSRKKKTGLCGDVTINAEKIVQEADYDVLVDVTPTNIKTGEPSLSYILQALKRGKSVVTSNKGPVSIAYPKILQTANEHNASFLFEGTVAGAIPIINGIQNGLAGNPIRRLFGVLNGTCNYILTRMGDEGLTYTQALNEAQDLGYTEADPTSDINGTDSAIKLVILANTIFSMGVTLKDVTKIGIDKLTPESLLLASKTNQTIRLIAFIDPTKKILEVSPQLIPKEHPLVVEGTLNAITIETELAGPITFIGRGAGSIETASAILSDLMKIKREYMLICS